VFRNSHLSKGSDWGLHEYPEILVIAIVFNYLVTGCVVTMRGQYDVMLSDSGR